jgi:hypothetical protein
LRHQETDKKKKVEQHRNPPDFQDNPGRAFSLGEAGKMIVSVAQAIWISTKNRAFAVFAEDPPRPITIFPDGRDAQIS